MPLISSSGLGSISGIQPPRRERFRFCSTVWGGSGRSASSTPPPTPAQRRDCRDGTRRDHYPRKNGSGQPDVSGRAKNIEPVQPLVGVPQWVGSGRQPGTLHRPTCHRANFSVPHEGGRVWKDASSNKHGDHRPRAPCAVQLPAQEHACNRGGGSDGKRQHEKHDAPVNLLQNPHEPDRPDGLLCTVDCTDQSEAGAD